MQGYNPDKTYSLVEQIQMSPELWGILIFTVFLFGSFILWFGNRLLKKQDSHHERQYQSISKLQERMHQMEVNMTDNYVKYTVFNTVIKDFKDELHSTIKPLCDRFTSIEEHLRNNK